MPTKPTKILAIDPGTKELGVAVLLGDRLEYYGVKTFKRRQPAHAFLAAVMRYVTDLIADHQPAALAVEKTYFIQRQAALLNITAKEIKHTAKRSGLAVFEFAPVKVRQHICGTEKSTKRQTAKILASRYPELARYLKQPSKWEALYWAHAFDAVAVGLVCFDEIFREPAE
jgi:Holliday junction resolvasome RuvABC endonuclease subunit